MVVVGLADADAAITLKGENAAVEVLVAELADLLDLDFGRDAVTGLGDSAPPLMVFRNAGAADGVNISLAVKFCGGELRPPAAVVRLEAEDVADAGLVAAIDLLDLTTEIGLGLGALVGAALLVLIDADDTVLPTMAIALLVAIDNVAASGAR